MNSKINNVSYTLTQLFTGQLTGHNATGNNVIIEDIMMNDDRKDSIYVHLYYTTDTTYTRYIESVPTILYVPGE